MKRIGDIVRKIQEDLSLEGIGTSFNADVSEAQATCPICRGKGFYVLDVPVGHPDFGRAVPCECQQEEWRRRTQARLQRISQLEHMREKTFATFSLREEHLTPAQSESLRLAYHQAMAFAENPHGWLLLLGNLGCGKTHLAAAIANERLRRGETVLFVVVPDLLDHLRATFHPGSEVTYDERFEEIRTAPLLILDDLGAESSTSWAHEKLYQLINYRYNARLPTVFTTNQRLEQLDARIRSRMLDDTLTVVCTITAPDYRTRRVTEPDLGLNILPLLRDMTFATWDDRQDDLTRKQADNLERAFKLASAYAEAPHNWLVFLGRYGTGKTHLAAAIANERARRGDNVLFVVVPDLLDYLRAAFSPESTIPYDQRFDEVKRASLLILDDLGIESATPWAREKLYQLLNYRYNAHLPTVITTAVPLEELDPRIRTRLLDPMRCTIFEIEVPAYRIDPDRKARRRRRR